MLRKSNLFAPAGTPAHVVAKLNAEVRAAFANQKFRERFDALGGDAVGNSPAEFRATVSEDMRKYAELVRLANIRPE